ncbi:MAG: hypothetical protein U9Q22_02905 [Candidatus Altiarchaeota archaeon]|nr:hypothetical protein [Candidatus Altiarchaeota archaeon]
MKKRLIITDLSKMKGDNICIFGVDEEGKAIRPVMPYSGITEKYILSEEDKQMIKPFAEIEFDFIRSLPKPPHTEDWEINTNYKPVWVRNLSEDEKKELLKSILDKSVKDIFEVVIHKNRYIEEGEGRRSIGTIKVEDVLFVKYSMTDSSKYEYRIKFLDMNGDIYDLPVTDLTFRSYCDELRIQKELNMGFIGAELKRISNQGEVFLRVGLGRFFKMKHWLFITGVYIFPNYIKKFEK